MKNLSARGFTLVELMIVMAVIAVLATISLVGLAKAQAAARDTQRQQLMNALRAANERYLGDTGAYPVPGANWGAYLAVLTAGGYLTAAPNDPCNGGTAIPATGIMAVCTPTTYSYLRPTVSTYTLTLTKESGGTNTFKSPQ